MASKAGLDIGEKLVRDFFNGDEPVTHRLLITDTNWVELYNNGQYRDVISCCSAFLQMMPIGTEAFDEYQKCSALEYGCRSMKKSASLQQARQLLSLYPDLVQNSPTLSLLQAELQECVQDQISQLEETLSGSSSWSQFDQDQICGALISVYAQVGNSAAALALLDRCTDIDDLRRADILLRLGRIEEAQQVLKSVVNATADTLVQHAICDIRLSKFSTAIQTLQGVLHEDPTHYIAALNLACAFVQIGQPVQAVNLLEECIRTDPAAALRQPHFIETLHLLYEFVKPQPVIEQETLSHLAAKYCRDLLPAGAIELTQ